jgi:hypothetical protein
MKNNLSLHHLFPALGLLITHEINLLKETGDSRSLDEIGISPSIATDISQLNAVGLRILSLSSFFHVSIDQKQLKLNLDQAKKEADLSDTIHSLIRKDAPRNMMMQFFGFTGVEYISARKTQGLAVAPIGRWQVPTYMEKNKDFIEHIDSLYREGIDLQNEPILCLSLSDQYDLTVRELLAFWKQREQIEYIR